MAKVDPLFAQWLQNEADYSVRINATVNARWGTSAVTSERTTGIATRASAEAEGDRQLAFFSRGPFAVDRHQLSGTDWAECIGRVVRLTIDQLGYTAGADVFVIAAEHEHAKGLSAVTVLYPLGGGA